jgi:hypothetical protein
MIEAAKAAAFAGAEAVITIAFEARVPVVTCEVYEAAHDLDRSRQFNERVLRSRCRVRSSDGRFARPLGGALNITAIRGRQTFVQARANAKPSLRVCRPFKSDFRRRFAKDIESAAQIATAADLDNRLFDFHTMSDRQVRIIDLKKVDFRTPGMRTITQGAMTRQTIRENKP